MCRSFLSLKDFLSNGIILRILQVVWNLQCTGPFCFFTSFFVLFCFLVTWATTRMTIVMCALLTNPAVLPQPGCHLYVLPAQLIVARKGLYIFICKCKCKCKCKCRDWEDKHTCPLYIAFCSGLGHQHTKGADGSRYQSIYEPTEPSQPMMSDDVSDEDRPQHRELRPLLFSNSVWVL